MTPNQYEVLCRHFIARKLKVPVENIREGNIRGISRLGRDLKHQIDMYWTTRDGVCEYYNIANAKWRTAKVKMGEVLLLQQVREELGANKALMITNTGFTQGAKDHAAEHRIGLYVVAPTFDFSNLEPKKRDVISTQMKAMHVATKDTCVMMCRNAKGEVVGMIRMVPGGRQQPPQKRSTTVSTHRRTGTTSGRIRSSASGRRGGGSALARRKAR